MEAIREYGGKIIGYVETSPNGDQTVRSFSGKIVGYYDASANVTRRFGGWIVATGNAATGLLFNPEYNPDYHP